MEEKILIKSEINTSLKNFLQKGSIISFVIAVLCALLLTIPEKVTRWSEWSYYITGWERMFYFGEDTSYFILFLIGSASLLFAIVVSIIYLPLRKCELQITESSVRGKALFGKEVVLPLHMVSAYSTKKFCSVIAVATASGITKFALVANYQEIGEVLAKKITGMQQPNETRTQETSSNAALDDIVKLKSLLDSGIISQEEFDAKKKQLLGL